MRILLQIIQFPPDVNSTGLLMAQVCEGLVERGHQVSVITTFPHYEKFRVWDEYRGKLAQRRREKNMNVLRLWVYASGRKQRMNERLLSYLSFNAVATMANLVSWQNYDVIFCTNGSFFSGISSYLSGGVHRVPFVYNIQDLYPETPVKAGQLKGRRAIAMLERMEGFMYRKAAMISVITPSFRENLLGKGVPSEKISMIPNFVDTDFIRPLPKVNEWSERSGLADKFVISHAGNLGYVYDLSTLLLTAARLRAMKDILFLIIGDGVAKPELERQAQEMQLDNVRFLPFQPYDCLPYIRAASDVQVSLYKHGSGDYSLPSKIYEVMASGRPLLASADAHTDVRQLVESTHCGICVEPENVDQLEDAILTLYHDPQLRAEMGSRGREHAVQNYSKDVVVSQYDALLREAAERGFPKTIYKN